MLFISGDVGCVGNTGFLVVWWLTVVWVVDLMGFLFVAFGSVLIAMSFVIMYSDGLERCIL